MIGFIQRYLLPKQVDFNQALAEQAKVVHQMACAATELASPSCQPEQAFLQIAEQIAREKQLKTRNINELLDVFITSYDKESLFRMITQLDWAAMSINHLKLELQAYDIHCLDRYHSLLEKNQEMTALLCKGINLLNSKDPKQIDTSIAAIHDDHDLLVSLSASAMAELVKSQNCHEIFQYRDVLIQIKDIARHIRTCANTLEDMALKVS